MSIEPYPLIMEPIVVPKIWGGRRLVTFAELPDAIGDPVGEIWSLSALPERPTRIVNGPLAGVSLIDALPRLGGLPLPEPFPVLLKLLEATAPLSVQLHPSDDLARRHGFPGGKNEAWIVLDTTADAGIIHGLREGTDIEEFTRALEGGSLDVDRYLRVQSVRTNDVIPIPSGTIHSALKGLLLAEVQQSSDVTYRLYDWGRNPTTRKLHVAQAMEALNRGVAPKLPHVVLDLENGSTKRRFLWACSAFVMEELSIEGRWAPVGMSHTFEVFMGIGGWMAMEYRGESLPIGPGRSILVPGSVPFSLSSRSAARALRVYAADLDSEIRPLLRAAGHSPSEIERVISTA